MGGALTPEFMEAMMKAADEQIAQYGPAGRGAIQVPAGGSWTNIGPFRSNWIQNGLQVQESDTGRVRTFLVHPTNPDVALRTDVERRPVEDDQLQSTAALVAGDDRHHPQHVGRQRGAREESRDHLSRHRRPVRPRRRRIRAPVNRRRPDVVTRDQARCVDGHPRREGRHERRGRRRLDGNQRRLVPIDERGRDLRPPPQC